MYKPYLITLLCLLMATAARAATYDVYILAGQSNMDGRGDAADLAEPLNSAQAGTRIYYVNPANPANAGEVKVTSNGWQTLAPGYSVPPGERGNALPNDAFGPELSFALAMTQANPEGNPIAIIKVSRGGTNLGTDWSPTGYMYQDLTAEIDASLKALAQEGHTATVRGMLWHQGESDSTRLDAYQGELETLINNVRTTLTMPELPFVIGELAQTKPQDFRQLQQQIADENDGVAFVSSVGLVTTDGTHFDANSQVILGQRYAQALTAVPEPGSLMLLFGGATLLLRR